MMIKLMLILATLSIQPYSYAQTSQDSLELEMRRARPNKFKPPAWNKPNRPPREIPAWNKPNRPPKFGRPWTGEDVERIDPDQTRPNSFAISSIEASGPGCPAGSVVTNISEDKEAFTVVFSDFLVELDGSSQGIDRQACRLKLNLDYEKGWEYSILGVAVRGYASLDEGVRARQSISLGNRTTRLVENFKGPMYEDYVRSEEFDLTRLSWSGCRSGSNDLDLVTRISLRSTEPSALGLFTVDSIDGEAEQIFELVWRPCNKRKNNKKSVICSIDLDRFKDRGKLNAFAVGNNAQEAKALATQKAIDRCKKFSRNSNRCERAKIRCKNSRFEY